MCAPKDTNLPLPRREANLAASIDILYLRYPMHPNITFIQIGEGIQRIEKVGDSYLVIGSEEGPLSGKSVEIPAGNVAAIQWALEGASAMPG